MPEMIFFVALISLATFLGCASSFYHKPVNYSSGNDGWLIIYCSNPQGQTEVIRHIVQVDQHDTLELESRAQIPILLSAGAHTLRFYSAGSLQKSHPYPGYTIFHDHFYIYGLSLEKEITILPGKRREIRYVAPFWNDETGTLKILK